MRIRTQGKVTDGLWYLGSEESCVYLLEGTKTSMLISGGMTYLVDDLLRQFDRFGIDESKIASILVLHAHFDHVGIIPFFLHRTPHITVYASARGWEILGMPKAVTTINASSRAGAERMGRASVYDRYDLDWHEGITGPTVGDGTSLAVDEFEVRIYETPGHSSCCVSAYVPELSALFCTDAAGIPYRDATLIAANSNFTQYQQSLEKLAPLDTDYVCADHYGYMDGPDAREHIARSIDCARTQRAYMEEVYRRTGDLDAAARTVTADFYKTFPDYIIAPDVMERVYKQSLRHVAAAMDTP